MRDKHLIKELQLAFSKTAKDGVIDLDRRLINRNSFNLISLKDLYVRTNGIIPPFRLSDIFIVFVKHGAGKRSIGHYTFNIQDNSLAIIPKRVIHAATYSSQPDGYLISFNPEFFLQQAFSYQLLNRKKVLKPSGKYPFIVLSEEQAREIKTIFQKIVKECDNSFKEKEQMVALKVLELLVLCDRFLAENDRRESALEYSDTLQTFNELVESNFSKHRDVYFYANTLHTHPNNLNFIVKKATGITAKQTIVNRLILEAKYLLSSTALSIKEIAYKLGFDDPNYFYSFFKKDQHATPAHYRNRVI